MRLLLLCEGDARTRDSFSGISLSLLRGFEARGVEVIPVDADLRGWRWAVGALLSISPDRRRWGVRHHLGPVGFRMRSRQARAGVRAASAGRGGDAILQIGATFDPGPLPVPRYLYSDANILLAEAARGTGVTDAGALRPREVRRIAGREARIYRSATAIFTISDGVRRSLMHDFGLPGSRVRTVYAGPNLEAAVPETRRVGVPSGPPTILFVGRQFLRKGGDLLLEAHAQLRAGIPEARLMIVGPPRPSGDAGSLPGVEWIGPLDRSRPEGWATLRQCYEEADVFCLPSRFEGLSIAILEAMAFGLPCVAVRHPWCEPEMILDGRTGSVVRDGSAEAVAAALRPLLLDRGGARRLGEAGRSRVREHFTWDRVVDAMLRGMQEPRGEITSGERPGPAAGGLEGKDRPARAHGESGRDREEDG